MRKYCHKNKIPLDSTSVTIKTEEPPTSTDKTDTISFEDKLELSEKVRKVPHEILAQLVKVVQMDCPGAFQELDKERIQIKVDALDKNTFGRLTE